METKQPVEGQRLRHEAVQGGLVCLIVAWLERRDANSKQSNEFVINFEGQESEIPGGIFLR